jgi:uncharacterized protein involved in exopolysaccharide biosynthesis
MGFRQQQLHVVVPNQKAVLEQQATSMERQLDRIKQQLSSLGTDHASR